MGIYLVSAVLSSHVTVDHSTISWQESLRMGIGLNFVYILKYLVHEPALGQIPQPVKSQTIARERLTTASLDSCAVQVNVRVGFSGLHRLFLNSSHVRFID